MTTIDVGGKDIRMRDLRKKRVAVVATDGFEQSELMVPVEAMRAMGATVQIVAPADTHSNGSIRGWNHGEWGVSVDVDETLDRSKAEQYDALVLPGGVMNPDRLRMREDATRFVRDFFKDGKPVGAICHGPQVLIDCGVIEGRAITSYPSIKIDLKNAGARWEDREVVCDQGLVSSRTPDDLPSFVDKMAEEIHEGHHAKQQTA